MSDHRRSLSREESSVEKSIGSSVSDMDTWLPFVIVVAILLVGIAVLVMRVVRNRSAPRDADDDAMRKEAADAYYRSQRDHEANFPPLGLPRRGDRHDGDGGS